MYLTVYIKLISDIVYWAHIVRFSGLACRRSKLPFIISSRRSTQMHYGELGVKKEVCNAPSGLLKGGKMMTLFTLGGTHVLLRKH